MKERTTRGTRSSLSATPPADTITAVMDPPIEVSNHAPSRAPSRDGSASVAPRRQRSVSANTVRHYATPAVEEHVSNRQAELFYLQKQIQLQTQMVFILEDGTRVQGIIEWYDRNSIKVRGKSRMLIYKTAIKYLYKAGEVGSAPGE